MEAITREEFDQALGVLYVKIDQIRPSGPRFIDRSQVIKDIGETELSEAIALGIIHPFKGKSRNSKVLIERSEYEAYIALGKHRR